MASFEMSDLSKLRMNVVALKRVDPYIKDIFDSASHVALYAYNTELNTWERYGAEGALFLYVREDKPLYGFIIMNRLNIYSVIQPLVQGVEFQVSQPFLLYRNKNGSIYGIWFYELEECIRISSTLELLLQQVVNQKNITYDVGKSHKNGKGNSDIIEILCNAKNSFLSSKVNEHIKRCAFQPVNQNSSLPAEQDSPMPKNVSSKKDANGTAEPISVQTYKRNGSFKRTSYKEINSSYTYCQTYADEYDRHTCTRYRYNLTDIKNGSFDKSVIRYEDITNLNNRTRRKRQFKILPRPKAVPANGLRNDAKNEDMKKQAVAKDSSSSSVSSGADDVSNEESNRICRKKNKISASSNETYVSLPAVARPTMSKEEKLQLMAPDMFLSPDEHEPQPETRVCAHNCIMCHFLQLEASDVFLNAETLTKKQFLALFKLFIDKSSQFQKVLYDLYLETDYNFRP